MEEIFTFHFLNIFYFQSTDLLDYLPDFVEDNRKNQEYEISDSQRGKPD